MGRINITLFLGFRRGTNETQSEFYPYNEFGTENANGSGSSLGCKMLAREAKIF